MAANLKYSHIYNFCKRLRFVVFVSLGNHSSMDLWKDKLGYYMLNREQNKRNVLSWKLWRGLPHSPGHTPGKTFLSCVSPALLKWSKNMVLLRRKANVRNVSFRISLRWPIHIINPFDKTKLSCNTPKRRSTTVSVETYPLWSKNMFFNTTFYSCYEITTLLKSSCPQKSKLD